MKRMLIMIGVLFFAFACWFCYVQAQGTGSQAWDDINTKQVSIPKELPKPKSQKWVDNLMLILRLEESYKVQYEQDSQIFKTNMPYATVIYQESNHVEWIKELLTAYGLSTIVRKPLVEQNRDKTKSLEYAIKVESDLIRRYEWLIENAEDETAHTVLGIILLQTRMNYAIFSHALWKNEMDMLEGSNKELGR